MIKLGELFPEELKRQVSKKTIEIKKNRQIDYAFPRLRKLPLVTERNIISAINHFLNVKGTTEEEKIEGYKKIIEKAQLFKICTMGFIEQCKNLFNKEQV